MMMKIAIMISCTGTIRPPTNTQAPDDPPAERQPRDRVAREAGDRRAEQHRASR